MNPKTRAVVLAAGKGTRMKSELPKVLISVAGKPMIEYVLDAIYAVGIEEVIVIVGYRCDLVQTQLSRYPLVFVEQKEQLGTGHAIQVAREEIMKKSGPILILAGDSPMIRPESLRAMMAEYHQSATKSDDSGQTFAGLIGTGYKSDPFGMGRILRDENNRFIGIVEQRDANEEQLRINEVNMSYYLFDSQLLSESLAELGSNNAQNEYYITDVPAIMLGKNYLVEALPILHPTESLGINTPEDLQSAEQIKFGEKNR